MEKVTYSSRGSWMTWAVEDGESVSQHELDRAKEAELDSILAVCESWPGYSDLSEEERHEKAEEDCEYHETRREPYDGSHSGGMIDSGGNG